MVSECAEARDRLVILLVEDELLVREMIAQYLRDCDCVVIEADDAEQAAAVGRSGQGVDVLITDINLSESENGWDIAEAFRAARPGCCLCVGKFDGSPPPRPRQSIFQQAISQRRPPAGVPGPHKAVVMSEVGSGERD